MQRQSPKGVLDGTTLSAEDTPANQKVFAQPKSQKKGCGFPLVRLVALFSLASGALLGFATGNYLQSELALAAQLWSLLEPGDVLLADRYFGCYRVLALVLGCQADAVCRLHASRQADFRYGKRRGPLDRHLVWRRPKQVPAGVLHPQAAKMNPNPEKRDCRFVSGPTLDWQSLDQHEAATAEHLFQ